MRDRAILFILENGVYTKKDIDDSISGLEVKNPLTK
jgi:hypothetical protein